MSDIVVPYQCVPYIVPVYGFPVPAKTCLEVKINPIKMKIQQWFAGIKTYEREVNEGEPLEVASQDVGVYKAKLFVELDVDDKTVWWWGEQAIWKMVKGPSPRYPAGKWDWDWNTIGGKNLLIEW
jgi:hypothetical protein